MKQAGSILILLALFEAILPFQGKAESLASEQTAFWATEPLAPRPNKHLAHSSWDRSSLDPFIRSKQIEAGIPPQEPADDRTLVRRLYLDLLGLPPSPEQTSAYLADKHPDRYARLVERLLASPAYGERWARHWLDVARFAESSGFEHDSDRPNAYPYRDFVIQALNANLPYNTFLAWQIAGDQLAPNNALAHAATGFLGAGVFPTQLTEKEFESARYDELDDMVSTIGTSMLGLSIGCARCHDHKFDPIPASDYYNFAATFTKTIRSEIELTSDTGQTIKTMVSTEGKPPMKHAADRRGFPHFYPETYVLNRGDVNKKGPIASPGFLTTLPSVPQMATAQATTDQKEARSNLAHWITDPEKGVGHLAARVIVNRLWQHHFGVGLVSTSNDFGNQGSPPSHPRLLDWLASELIDRDWNLKSIQRLIVTSATYRQTSQANAKAAAIDPKNTLLWRYPPRRLEAETIRDSMLAMSSQLDRSPFGAGSLDPDMRRRSIYFFLKRSRLIPLMLLFDFPEPLASIGRRATTNIAPQGLTLMNSPTIRRYAEGLVQQAKEGDSSKLLARTINRLFEIAYNRPATAKETKRAIDFIEQQQLPDNPRPDEALTDLAQSLFMSNEFLYIK